MDECIFCSLVNKQRPSYSLYTDENIFAFLDIFPAHPGHALIIPREHHSSLITCSEELAASMMRCAHRLASVVLQHYPAFNLHLSNGPQAGQEIFHVHLHLIPRQEEDHASWDSLLLLKNAAPLEQLESWQAIYRRIFE